MSSFVDMSEKYWFNPVIVYLDRSLYVFMTVPDNAQYIYSLYLVLWWNCNNQSVESYTEP